MTIIFLLIPLSVVIATAFLFAFIWAVRSGQYEDTYTPSLRLLLSEREGPKNPQQEKVHSSAPDGTNGASKPCPRSSVQPIISTPNAYSNQRSPLSRVTPS